MTAHGEACSDWSESLRSAADKNFVAREVDAESHVEEVLAVLELA